MPGLIQKIGDWFEQRLKIAEIDQPVGAHCCKERRDEFRVGRGKKKGNRQN